MVVHAHSWFTNTKVADYFISNTVMVTAPTDSMKVVEQIVQEMEADPTTVYQFRSYPLTFADATATATATKPSS